MNNQEKDFREFFAEMRKKDEQILIPEFDELVKRRQRSCNLFIPLSAAASIVLLISIYFYFQSNQKPVSKQTVLEISLITGKHNNTKSLIPRGSSIDEWHSPSDFLIDDFDEW